MGQVMYVYVVIVGLTLLTVQYVWHTKTCMQWSPCNVGTLQKEKSVQIMWMYSTHVRGKCTLED